MEETAQERDDTNRGLTRGHETNREAKGATSNLSQTNKKERISPTKKDTPLPTMDQTKITGRTGHDQPLDKRHKAT